MKRDKCHPSRGKWVKIPISSENADKRGVNNLGANWRVTTPSTLKTIALTSNYAFSIYILSNSCLAPIAGSQLFKLAN